MKKKVVREPEVGAKSRHWRILFWSECDGGGWCGWEDDPTFRSKAEAVATMRRYAAEDRKRVEEERKYRAGYDYACGYRD